MIFKYLKFSFFILFDLPKIKLISRHKTEIDATSKSTQRNQAKFVTNGVDHHKIRISKTRLKYEVDQLNEELQIQKDTFSQAEKKWKECFFREFSVDLSFKFLREIILPSLFSLFFFYR